MRSRLAVLVAVINLCLLIQMAPRAYSQASPASCNVSVTDSALDCGGSYVRQEPGSSAGQGGSGAYSSSGAETPEAHSTPGTRAGGSQITSYSSSGTAPSCVTPPHDAYGYNGFAIGQAGGARLVFCPTAAPAAARPAAPAAPTAGGGTPTPAPPPIDPATLAVSFWRTIPLPAPHPTIPPGYAITGLPAYLVTHGELRPASYAQSTPLGPLTVTAIGQYLIDWGDGTAPVWCGPYAEEGRAYPNGNIAHTYDITGRYTVTVVEIWTARWQLGGASGILTGLRTQATIPAFRVGQLQAVITG
jgi:hypothetical protein